MWRLNYSVLIVILYLNSLPVSSQYVESPCPGTFEYKSDGSGVYGVIHLQPDGLISSIHIIANFTIATRLLSNYVGRLEPVNPQALQNQQFYQDAPIDYRVHFPVTSPLPRLTALVVNGNVLCYGPGDVVRPNQYVTTTSLQHMLYLRGGGGGGGFNGYNGYNQFKPARPKPQDPSYNVIGPSSNTNTQIYTFNVDNDRSGNWNSGGGGFNGYNYYNQFHPARPKPQNPSYNIIGPSSNTNTQIYTFNADTDRSWNAVPTYQQPQLQTPRTPPPPPEYYAPPPTTTRRPAPPPPRPETYYTPATAPPSRRPSTNLDSECGVVSGGNEHVPLIFHGQNFARGDWPWLVAIYKRKDGSLNFICSGTLVSNLHVVTAAHCMHIRNTVTSIKDFVVKVGVYNLEDWGDDITVTRTLATATIHESYNSSTFANDLLVFTFERSVNFNTNIRPACLWTGNSDLRSIVGASGVVAGWGSSERGPGITAEPTMVRIPIVSTDTCRASKPDYHLLTSENTLCAGDRNGAGPCRGDSGGGLYLLEGGRWRLRGVVSASLRPGNGDNTCNLNEYIIFTDAAKYSQWIKNIIRVSL